MTAFKLTAFSARFVPTLSAMNSQGSIKFGMSQQPINASVITANPTVSEDALQQMNFL
jgi:hypothetical protein